MNNAASSSLAAPIALLTQCAHASYIAVLKGESIMMNENKTLREQNSDLKREFERSENDVQRLIQLEDARKEEMQRLKDETVALRHELQKSEKAEKAAKHELMEMQRFYESELARIALAGKEIYDERTALIEALRHQLHLLMTPNT
jgi:membrane protein involved in colicin uptake